MLNLLLFISTLFYSRDAREANEDHGFNVSDNSKMLPRHHLWGMQPNKRYGYAM